MTFGNGQRVSALGQHPLSRTSPHGVRFTLRCCRSGLMRRPALGPVADFEISSAEGQLRTYQRIFMPRWNTPWTHIPLLSDSIASASGLRFDLSIEVAYRIW